MFKTWKQYVVAVFLLLLTFTANAAIRITPATGGEAISADTAANGLLPAWTTLGPINLKERNFGHRNRFTTGTNQTLVLQAPSGFQFNPAVTPSITFASNKDLVSANVEVGTNTLTITFSVSGETAADEMVIGGTVGLQVQPVSSSPLASGNIYRPSGPAGGTAIIRGLQSTANANGLGSNVSNFGTLVETASTAAALGFQTPPSERGIAEQPFGRQPVVAVTDGYGNIRTNETGRTVTATLFSGPGQLIGTMNVPVVNGIAAYTNLGANQGGAIVIEFSSPDLISVLSDTIIVDDPRSPAVATSIKIVTQPSNTATAGVAFAQQPIVAIIDQYDLVISNDNSSVVTVSRWDGSGDLQGTVELQAVNGTVTFTNLSHNVANTITLSFASPTLNPAVSGVIAVQPAAASSLTFTTQPGDATVGSPFGIQPIVEAVDAFGNASVIGISTNLSVALALTSGTGTLLGTTTLDIGTDEGNGTVIFTDLQIDVGGVDKQLTASAAGLSDGVSALFAVAGGSQTITFDPISDKVYGDAPFEVTAIASSGLPVTFSIESGPATISDNVVTIVGTGTVTVSASQEGDINYNPAPPVDQSFNVAKAAQTITFDAPADKVVTDAPFALSATASSGLTVSFEIVSGPATVTDGTVTITGVGTVTVRASQAGDDNYEAAADVDQSFNVAKASQTITFGALADKVYGEAAFSISATASSGLSVNLSVLSGPATIDEGLLTITGVGTVTVRASQGGNANYEAAVDVDQSFNVAKADQTITFGALANKVFGDAPFSVAATSSSGLSVSFSVFSGPATISGSTVTITGAGSVVIRASEAGNANYNAAPNVDQAFQVAKANQTITFGPISDKLVDAAPFTVSGTASSGLSVSFSILAGPASISGDTVTLEGVGTVTVRASQAGDANYNTAPVVDQSFEVGKLSQSITFDSLTNKVYGDEPFVVAASASSTLTVGFSILSGPAEISDDVVTITGVGTVVVRALQEGNETYNAAGVVDQSFDVSPALLTVTSHDQSRMFSLPNPIWDGTVEGLQYEDIITAEYGSAATVESPIGTYPITIALIDSSGSLSNYTVVTNIGQLTITALPLPVIGTQPAGVKKSQGGDICLSVNGAGIGMTYQWRRNGVPINGATGTALNINHARVDKRGNYDVVITNPSGSITSSVAKVEIVFIPCDFDEEGQSEIVFQQSNGPLALWYMNGTTFRSGELLLEGESPGPLWRLAAQHDFNGDGHTDLLFQHKESGVLVVWLMEGTEMLETVSLRDVNTNWEVAGASDFNKDGHTDILFQSVDGTVAVWYMEGTEFISAALLRTGTSMNNWNVVGVRDLDGAGTDDIVFQNENGWLAVWFMDGSERIGISILRRGPPLVNGWKVVGVTDCDRDDDIDLLWQHTTGVLAIWKFDGTDFVGAELLRNGQRVSPGWTVMGAK